MSTRATLAHDDDRDPRWHLYLELAEEPPALMLELRTGVAVLTWRVPRRLADALRTIDEARRELET